MVLPTQEQRIDDGAFSTGLRNYEEFFQGMVSLAGESQNFDGNGHYVRIQAGGPFAVQTPSLPEPTGPLARERESAAPRHASGEEPEAALQART